MIIIIIYEEMLMNEEIKELKEIEEKIAAVVAVAVAVAVILNIKIQW